MKYEMYKQHHICKPKYIWYILLNIKISIPICTVNALLFILYISLQWKTHCFRMLSYVSGLQNDWQCRSVEKEKNVDQLLLTVSLRDHRLLRKWNTLDLYWQLYFYISFEFNAILLKVGLSVFNALYPQGHDFENYIHMELLYKGFWR